LRRIAIFFIAAFVLILLYGLFIEPNLIDREQKTVAIPDLPPAWEGKRVAVISDFQVGMWMDNTGTIRRITRQLAEEQLEAVLILGDFVYHPVQDAGAEVDRVVSLIRPLTQSGIPTYAVLGNHDYAMNGENDTIREDVAERVRTALENAGVQMLVNEAVPFKLAGGELEGSSPESEDLYLVGLGARYPDNDHAEVALSQIPDTAARVVIMHHPESFAKLPAYSAPLALAGHTHGGQIRIPFFPKWSWLSLIVEDDVHTDGWIDGFGAPGNRLYVNRGIGFSLLPVRIGSPPEVTYLTLTQE
jgi:uncharacterized protein